MIDTVRVEWEGAYLPDSFYDWWRAEYPDGGSQTEKSVCNTKRWYGTMAKDEHLGTVGSRSGEVGARIWGETSLGKFAYGDNCKLMSKRESLEVLDWWLSSMELKFTDWLRGYAGCVRGQAVCRRVDFYWQREVPNSVAVCQALVNVIDGKRCVLYPTSVELLQSRQRRARWYDKGVESKNSSYVNVLRHEEQIRGKSKAMYYLNVSENKLKSDEVRLMMNERYKHLDGKVECVDVSELLREYGAVGLGVAALVLQPSLEHTAKQELAKNTYYKYRNLAKKARGKTIVVDLAIPRDGWGDSE